MSITTTHIDRAARVAAAVEEHIGQETCEAVRERAGKEADDAAREGSAAGKAVRALTEGDPEWPVATARYHAARARFEAARAAFEMAEATCKKQRAVAEAAAWDNEADTVEQGNPHTPHTPQNAAWAEGRSDAERGHDSVYSRPDFARAAFGDYADHYRDGYEAATPGRPAAERPPVPEGERGIDAETLQAKVQALLGDGFSVAIYPNADYPAVEINPGNGALESVALTESGRYYATQWAESGVDGQDDDAEFDTLAEAVEYARVGTTREG
jgi:hypothetical protein